MQIIPGIRENIRNTIRRVDREDFACYFFRVYRNLGGESQTGRDAHRERGQLKTRGRFTGKWFAEGKGNGETRSIRTVGSR